MTGSGGNDAQGDNVRQAAAAALADVDALAVEGEDRSIVLKALLQARLGTFTPTAPSYSGPGGETSNGPDGTSEVAADSDVLGKIGATLNVDRDTLDLVYSLMDGEPHVLISAKKLAKNKAQAARQLGQLIAAARQIAGIEEWTSVATIRKVVTEYGRLDSGNFAATIQQMDDVAVIRGKGHDREIKITRPGLEATTELIKNLVGAES